MDNKHFKLLCDLKDKIDNLTTRQKELLYKDCLQKLEDFNKTSNKSGVYFDLRIVSLQNLKLILEYLNNNIVVV